MNEPLFLATAEGIEPPLTVLETVALPLYYAVFVWWGLKESNLTASHSAIIRQWIYSPPQRTAPITFSPMVLDAIIMRIENV